MKSVSFKRLAINLSSIGHELWTSANKDTLSIYISELCIALLELKGEASSVALAEEIISAYQDSDAEEKLKFFLFLFDELNSDPDEVDKAIENYQTDKTQERLYALSRIAESPRQDLFRALNMASEGTSFLIKMRKDLYPFINTNPNLKMIDQDLLHLFKSWFNRGFLELKHIDWNTPAKILEKLIKYESVHEIQGWSDLRRRLESDRRCFGFFHPAMPNTPLIFVEVALTQGLDANISNIIEQNPPTVDAHLNATTAIFYSINNCFAGLRGVSFGNFLIKQVVEELASEMPNITTYSTLSPVPGFITWLQKNLDSLEFLSPVELDKLKQYLLGEIDHSDLSSTLLSLCAHYLLRAKKGDKPANPVARFHLGNGARLERINWEADLSENGKKQSAGIMVNYLYNKKTLTRNHEAYEQTHKIIRASQVNKLLPKARK